MNKNYNNMTDAEKLNLLKQLYEIENKSFGDIASQLSTYANKIRRDAIKFKIKIKNKSEAQSNAIKTGKHKHPTKGQQRSDTVKNKIGNSLLEVWDSLTDKQLLDRKEKAKENWNKLSEDEKNNMLQKANSAVRIASKQGSKLEKFLLEQLIKDGYNVIFHQEQSLSNTKLQIDLFIPNINVAIEVDGPSHFEPVWGEDSLQKNIKYDNKKTGLILGKGLVLIRIKQTKDFSKSRSYLIYDQLKNILEQIKVKFPNADNRCFNIEDK